MLYQPLKGVVLNKILIVLLVSLLVFIPTISRAADTQVSDDVGGQIGVMATGLWGPFWLNTTTAVIALVDGGADMAVERTTNSGVDWTPTVVNSVGIRQAAAWFDQQTPGDDGTLLHMAYMDSTDTTVYYRTFDISADSLGTERTVDATVTVSTSRNLNRIGITKARSGNLVICFETPTEIECYDSTDGITWNAVGDAFETAGQADFILMYPANMADTADVAAIFWDRSANEITAKIYDDSDSGGVWTQSTSTITATADNVYLNMDCATRHSDGLILCAAHNAHDTAGNDIVTWSVTPTAEDPTIITENDVVTNLDESAMVSLFINQQNDKVYVAYLKGGTWEGTVDVKYRTNTAFDTATWSSENAYSEAAAGDFEIVRSGRTVDSDGGFFQPVWYEDLGSQIFNNLVNDVPIAASISTRRVAIPIFLD